MPDISIVIATHNMGHLILDTLLTCYIQKEKNIEIIVYDDSSTDGTEETLKTIPGIKYFRSDINHGVGDAFNEGIKLAGGDIVVLMCADDLFTNEFVLTDILSAFRHDEKVGYVSRWYYQFVDGYTGAVRAWRTRDPIIQANNPSGLAFRREALKNCKCSNRMFIETSALAKQVLDNGWDYRIITWDTIKARVHASTSTKPGYFLKRRVSSPVEDWISLGAKDIAKDYVSFIQIKTGFTSSAVIEEILNFIKYRPINLITPQFWFWTTVSLFTPRRILRKLTSFYRHKIGRFLTKEITRPC